MAALLFDKLPRTIKPRRVMMHFTDAGVGIGGGDNIHYECEKCGHEEWIEYEGMRSNTDVFRGEPCPNCNKEKTDVGQS